MDADTCVWWSYVPVGIIAGICETVQSQPPLVMPCGFVAFELDVLGMVVPAFVAALLQRACHNTRTYLPL